MIVIIADDLTGAAETVGICLRYGVRVAMIMDVPDEERLLDFQREGTAVLVIAGDTRSNTQEGACRVSRLLGKTLKQAGLTQIFKKIDSVLRGWVLPELNTLASLTDKSSLLIQPANPQAGRCIRDGKYYINGIELSQTAFSSDPEFPASTANVMDLLQERLSAKDLTPTLKFRIPDAGNAEDLRDSALQCAPEVLPAGSAAFWEAYLKLQIQQNLVHAQKHHKQPLRPSMQNFLMVCGSAHQHSLDFAEQLNEKGIRLMEMPPELSSEQKPDSADLAAWMNACVEAWEKEPRLALRIASKPIRYENSADRLKARFTDVLQLLLQQIKPAELFIEGGATAASLLSRLNWISFKPVDELAPGVVRLQLNNKSHLFITLKPGSYSWPEFIFNS
ncbi:MAG: four-carbon acid sugar kinase family protein [Bacteroidales bacterium]|nr:four-carbon acid sugar kinase family protein [Bacteroidales bacterium]MDD4360977.1 four-carbon acid sugar kinase family protein [Bacteroidales bacterium]MDD4430003.1 four-carbon acid sugar kinase family protein [Bacteroidales bacterium]